MTYLKTHAIYQDTPHGRKLLMLFTPKHRGNGRQIAMQFHEKYPDVHKNGKLYLVTRWKCGDEITEGEMLEMDGPEHENTDARQTN